MTSPQLRLASRLVFSVCACTPGAPALACPDCQYEACIAFACACLPKLGCIIPGAPSIPTVGQVADDIRAGVDKGIRDIRDTVAKSVSDLQWNLDKAGKDTEKTVAKAAKDIEAEVGRAGKHTEEAVSAIGHYIEAEAHSAGKALSNAEKRVREGKVIDALWHLGTEPLQASEENAANAALESSLIRTVGQVAASVYGGPGGAAAYAAWLTFHETGDPNLALRVGILTGASSDAFSNVQATVGRTRNRRK